MQQYSANRESVAHSLGCGDEIGFHAGKLMGKEFACSPIARLNLIENKQSRIFLARLLNMTEKGIVRDLNSANSLDSFDNNCSDITAHHRIKRCNIIKRCECYLVPGVKGCNNLGIIRRSHRTRSTSMKCFP